MLTEIDVLLALTLRVEDSRKSIIALCKELLVPGTTTPNAHPLLRAVSQSVDPAGAIRRTLTDLDYFKDRFRDCVQAGAHGCVVVGDEVQPLYLNTETPEDLDWFRANEVEAAKQCAEIAFDAIHAKIINCKVLFFTEQGFSGIPTQFTVTAQGALRS